MDKNTNGGLSSVWRELRLALGEIVSGGQLNPKQTVFVQVLFGLLGHLARADSVVGIEEAQFSNTLMDELKLPSQGRKLASEAFAHGSLRHIDLDRELKSFLTEYPRGSTEIGRLYTSLLRLAAADGKVRSAERHFLERVTAGLGFTAGTLDARLKSLGIDAAKAR